MIEYGWNDAVIISAAILLDKQLHPDAIPLEFDAFLAVMSTTHDRVFVDAVMETYLKMLAGHRNTHELLRKELVNRYSDFE